MSRAFLLAAPLSPWSEKARWPLDHHGIDYVEKAHLPLLRAPLMRWKLRRLPAQTASGLPLLFDRRGTLCLDPLDIARYAERSGAGEPLFRRGHEAQIDRWHRLSEQAMHEARALAAARAAERPAGRDQVLPAVVPRRLTGLLMPAAAAALRFLRGRHGAGERGRTAESTHRARVRAILLELRRTLADGRRYLVGDSLSYCDIAMASALIAVEPVTGPDLPPDRKRSSTDLELAGEFPDVLGWRDQIYADHRRAGRRRP